MAGGGEWGEGWTLARTNVKESIAFKVGLGSRINHINLGFANSEFLNLGISRLSPGIKKKKKFQSICLTCLKEKTIFNHVSHNPSHSANRVRTRWSVPWGIHTTTTTILIIVETLSRTEPSRGTSWVVEMLYNSELSYAEATGQCCYWALEMCLMGWRNWLFNSISFLCISI